MSSPYDAHADDAIDAGLRSRQPVSLQVRPQIVYLGHNLHDLPGRAKRAFARHAENPLKPWTAHLTRAESEAAELQIVSQIDHLGANLQSCCQTDAMTPG